MARIKRGTVSRRKHNKILGFAKGYRMSRHRLFQVAKEAVLHAGQYAFNGRKLRKRDLRSLWIVRISQAVKSHNMTYSQFINKLKVSHVKLDRKILAHLASEEPTTFAAIVKKVSE